MHSFGKNSDTAAAAIAADTTMPPRPPTTIRQSSFLARHRAQGAQRLILAAADKVALGCHTSPMEVAAVTQEPVAKAPLHSAMHPA